ncbi:MAG: GGDEF domain-containing protein [Holophagales bacterium]|nr:GGDEF domain-containing protein [Holophagales bacterium]
MDKLYKRFRRRLIGLCMVVLAALVALVHFTVYVTARADLFNQAESNAKGVAASVADSIMLDVEGYKSFLESKDPNSEYYKKMHDFLAKIQDNISAKYIYTERKLDANTTEFILDANPINGEGYSAPGTTDKNNDQKEMLYETRAPMVYKEHVDKWGRLFGAYAPILGEDGEWLGHVGVDMDYSHLSRYLFRLNAVLVAIYVLIVGFSLALLMRYSNTILDPLLKDKLTGAYNKRYFENFLGHEIAHSLRSHKELALLMLDLDHFKRINDTYGHVFGDKVLASIADTVRSVIRPQDFFIRYGGEEFAVMIANSDMKQVMDVAERIRSTVESTPIFNEEKNIPVNMTISIGASRIKIAPISPKELIEQADKALYDAKERRNMVSVFEMEL